VSSEAIAPPDVEKVLIDYLEPLLGVPGSSNVPSNRPSAFFLVTAAPSLGGFSGVALYESVLTVESWNDSRTEASRIAREAVARLLAATSFQARPGGPGWLPDPDSGTPRYVFTTTIYIHGSVL